MGDIAEKAELLGLGQSLIYSIEQTDVPMMLVVLRKGTAAAHYVMGGPTANNHNAFTLGTPTTEIYVMHGETAAAASYARRLVKEKDSGKPSTADDREDERDREALRRVLAAVLTARRRASSTRWCASRTCGSTWWPSPTASTRTRRPSARSTT